VNVLSPLVDWIASLELQSAHLDCLVQAAEGWIDPDLLSDLDACWPGFDEADNARALLHSRRLFHRLTRRTTEVIGYTRFDADGLRDKVVRILAMNA
jgi:hypothetical protein